MFRSLRFRLLGPLLLAAIVAAGLVAIVSVSLADRWAENELDRRYKPIERALSDAAFPLNPTVIGSIAQLTRTEWTTFDEAGERRFSTIDDAFAPKSTGEASAASLGDRNSDDRYIVRRFKTIRPSTRADGVWAAAVYFDRQELDATRTRALVLLMATGLSTVVGLTTATLLMSSRLIERLRRLKERVEAVAKGDFQTRVSDHADDELGQLGTAVDQMAEQLDLLPKVI
ncbi:MAG: HAMP domain-containing protein, partial [Planctomycetota bacterium]